MLARFLGMQAKNALAPAISALRGETKGPLTFEANGVVIVLDLQPASEGKVNILGQVAADDQDKWTGALVELRQADQMQLSTIVDDLGAFRFESAIPGAKELRLTSKDKSFIFLAIIEKSV